MSNLFKIATQNKYRFDTGRGRVSVEDLWDLPLTELDQVYKYYSKALKEETEESLLQQPQPSAGREAIVHRRDIVVAVVRTKQREAELREQQALSRQKKARILALLAQKQDSALEQKSEDELKELLSQLE